MCNLPRRRFVAVRALHGPDVVLDTVVTLPDAPTTMVAFALKERGRASATGTVVGFAADSAGNPVPGVEIIVGLDVHTRTDSLGNFVVPAVKAGTTLVRARRLGFAPVAMATVVPPDGAASLSVTMQPVTLLPTVIARADSMADMPDNQMHKLDLFYQRSAQRRMSGLGGDFFTETDIERRHPVKLSDLLEGKARRLPQCRNATVGGIPRYELFIDDLPYGTFTMDSPEVLDAIPVSWVVGVEVYTSVAELPVEAMGNGCAAIFVWLR